MRVRRRKSFSIRGPVTLFSAILVLILMLTALWNVVLVHDYQKFRDLAQETASFHWTLIAVGSTLFLTIIVLGSILGAQLIARTRSSQRQSSFVASVTHELNSPLSAVKLFAQTLREPALAEADRIRFVGKILSEVERLNRIIGNILRAAEVDNRGERLPIAASAVNLHTFLRTYVDEARMLRSDEVALTVGGDPTARVEIDPLMFRQVLNNLVDNAVRHGGRKPVALDFSVSGDETHVELRATDDGLGISPKHLVSIFHAFSQAGGEVARTATGGIGIGLFVVQTIVDAHGGEVGAESLGDGRGATIWIRLPRAAERGAAA